MLIGGSVAGYRVEVEVPTDPLSILIAALEDDGIFVKLDRLWIFAQPTAAEALVDLVASATATAVGNPAFEANRGYTGVDTSASVYIDSNFNPSTAGGNYAQDSAHLSVWSNTNAASGAGGGVVIGQQVGTPACNIFLRYSDGSAYCRINSSSAPGGSANANSLGHYLGVRPTSTETDLYKNGILYFSPDSTSAPLINSTVLILGLGAIFGGSALQISMASIGGALTSTEVANFYGHLRTYFRAINPIYELVEGLRDDGILAKLDRLWVFAQPTQAQALVDLVASTTATAVNSPTFTANRGYTGDGVTSYINSLFNPSTNGVNWVGASVGLHVWCITNRAANDTRVFGFVGSGGAGVDFITNGSATSGLVITYRFDPTDRWTNSNSDGFFSVNMDGNSSNQVAQRNGSTLSLLAGGAIGATVPSDDIWILGRKDAAGSLINATTDQIACVAFGGKLTATEAGNFYTHLRTYMTAVGVP
jgi:hypothetical protein